MAKNQEIAALQQQLADLQKVIGGLTTAGAPAEEKPKQAPYWKKASAETKKAAHNAGRQAQLRHKKGSKAGVTAYKKAFDAHLVGQGFRPKYSERDARRAAAAARKAA
jgi:hypothetical protein